MPQRIKGLRAAGWQGDWRAARFGYAALKYGCLAFWLHNAGDVSSHTGWECLPGRPMAEYIENQGRLVAYLLDLADAARGLLEAVAQVMDIGGWGLGAQHKAQLLAPGT